MPIEPAVSHLVGLQAQRPDPPHVGLWSRIAGLDHRQIDELLDSRALVRAAAMRSTVHLLTANDALALRPVVQPAMDRELQRAGVQVAALGRHDGRGCPWPGTLLRAAADVGRSRCRAGRRVPAGRPACPRDRRPQRDGPGADPTARPVAHPGSDGARSGDGLDRSGRGDRCRPGPADPALPGRLRPGDGHRHRDLVGPAGRHRRPPADGRRTDQAGGRPGSNTRRHSRRHPARPADACSRSTAARIRQRPALARRPDQDHRRRLPAVRVHPGRSDRWHRAGRRLRGGDLANRADRGQRDPDGPPVPSTHPGNDLRHRAGSTVIAGLCLPGQQHRVEFQEPQ